MTTATDAQQLEAIRPVYGYYRQPNGWITVAVTTELEQLRYIKEGWESLAGYGRFEMGTVYMANHPLEGLLMRGGSHELPVEQVVEMGFWMNPPVVPTCGQLITQNHKHHEAECWQGAQPAEFPQVPPDTPRAFACDFCERKSPTQVAKDQHESVVHSKQKGEKRTGDALGMALVAGLAESGVTVAGQSVEVEDSPGREGTPEAAEHPFVCGFCRIGFDNVRGLSGHVKEHPHAHEAPEHKEGLIEGAEGMVGDAEKAN